MSTDDSKKFLLSVSPDNLLTKKIDKATGENIFWTCEPDVELPIRIGTDPESDSSRPPQLIIDLMKKNCKEVPHNPAYRVKRNGAYITWTWKDVDRDNRRFAKAAIKVGLQAHQCICIIGFNSPEWIIANVGAIYAGGIASGIYSTNGIEATYYIAHHSKSVIAVAEDTEQVNKFIAKRDSLPDLRIIVQYSGSIAPEHARDGFVVSWEDFLASADSLENGDEILEQRLAAQRPGHCCSLIYTSGTTGNPKAVMLSQDNLTWTAGVALQRLKFTKDERLVSYLPLSHVAAQIIDVYGTIVSQGCLSFAQPDALKGSLVTTLQEVRPTFFVAVPRVWEKMEESIKAIAANNSALKQLIGTWAKSVGLRGTLAKFKNESVPYGWTIADKLVFSNVKKALGLDAARFFVSSAAPIGKDTIEFFMSLDIPLAEVYGMSECTGPHFMSYPDDIHPFTVGKPFSGAVTKLIPPGENVDTHPGSSEGEICMWGRHIFMGYLYAKEATMETFTPGGFIHSGDLSRRDEEGCYVISGRIKELLITAGGENVAPVPIEDTIKHELPFISNAMVIGDKRKFLTSILTFKTTPDENLNPSNVLTPMAVSYLQEHGVKIQNGAVTKDLLNNPEVAKIINEGFDRINKVAVSQAQKVQKWVLIPEDFSIASGDLTPTMKLKRKVVYEKYLPLIEKLYSDVPAASLPSKL